jgi:DNA repair exonuclease SbcCD ATPase subunit
LAQSTQAPSLYKTPSREEQQQAQHKANMSQNINQAVQAPSDQPTKGPSLSVVNMGSIEDIRTDLSEHMKTQMELFQKQVMDGIESRMTEQTIRNSSQASVDESTLTNITATMEEKFRKEINSDKNFRDTAHHRLVSLEKTNKSVSDTTRQLQELVRRQQETIKHQHEDLNSQIDMLTQTFHTIQTANETAQAAAQENIKTLQSIVQTTHEQSKDTQQNVALLASSMSTITNWIQAQPIQQKAQPMQTDNGPRPQTKYKLPPISVSPKQNSEAVSPRRQTDQDNNRPEQPTT